MTNEPTLAGVVHARLRWDLSMSGADDSLCHTLPRVLSVESMETETHLGQWQASCMVGQGVKLGSLQLESRAMKALGKIGEQQLRQRSLKTPPGRVPTKGARKSRKVKAQDVSDQPCRGRSSPKGSRDNAEPKKMRKFLECHTSCMTPKECEVNSCDSKNHAPLLKQ